MLVVFKSGADLEKEDGESEKARGRMQGMRAGTDVRRESFHL